MRFPGFLATPTSRTSGLLTRLLVLLLPALSCRGQDIEPRRWGHLPIGANFAAAAYASASGDIFLDPALQIENAQFDIETIGGKYIRSFELFGKSARIDFTQAYQMGHWSGLLAGAPASAEREGWADSTMRFAVNLIGAPPLAGKEFAAYRAKVKHETILGLGLVAQLPTGQYFDDKLINLGNNRFTFRPQLGVVHNWSKWSVELNTSASFYTDNDDFFNGKRLEQDPLFSTDAHLIYTFRPGLWLAASAGFSGGGATTVNGRQNDDRQRNLLTGLGLGVPINSTTGVKIGWIGTRTHARTGLDADLFTFAISVMW
jgi:hypothetical protein